MNKLRSGEKHISPSRNPRYVCSNGIWHFKTRGGEQIGPFTSRQEMQDELDIYIREQQKQNTSTPS